MHFKVPKKRRGVQKKERWERSKRTSNQWFLFILQIFSPRRWDKNIVFLKEKEKSWETSPLSHQLSSQTGWFRQVPYRTTPFKVAQFNSSPKPKIQSEPTRFYDSSARYRLNWVVQSSLANHDLKYYDENLTNENQNQINIFKFFCQITF